MLIIGLAASQLFHHVRVPQAVETPLAQVEVLAGLAGVARASNGLAGVTLVAEVAIVHCDA